MIAGLCDDGFTFERGTNTARLKRVDYRRVFSVRAIGGQWHQEHRKRVLVPPNLFTTGRAKAAVSEVNRQLQTAGGQLSGFTNCSPLLKILPLSLWFVCFIHRFSISLFHHLFLAFVCPLPISFLLPTTAS